MTQPLQWHELSNREQEVLRLLAEGKKKQEIANAVGLSKSHIDKMLSNTDGDARAIYPKIGVSSATGAVSWYHQNSPEVPDSSARPTYPPGQRSEFHVPTTFLYSFTTLYACIILLTFIPGLLRGGGDDLDKIYVNIYLLIPAVAGVYGFAHFQNQKVDKSFFRIFRLFSIGLICWAVGAVIWMILDLVEGLVPHYPSFADLGYGAETIIQTICFYLWWREVCRRTGQTSLAWVPIALVLIVVYYTALYSVRDASEDLLTNTSRFALDIMYTLGDSLSLAWAISLLLPWSIKWLDSRIKIAMSFMTAGMVGMFVAGSGFYITTSLPDGDYLYYGSGGWVDLVFATGLFLFGIAIAVASSCSKAFVKLKA